jgi:hypothetical protein
MTISRQRDEPLVSVVIPVRDEVGYLQEAVRSILDQTLREIEVIIVSDRSGAEARKALQALIGVDPRIRVTDHDGAGVADALNAGLATARAPLVARMDGDDVAAPDRLQLQYDHLRTSRHALVGSAARVIDENGDHGVTISVPRTPEDIRAQLEWRNCILHPTVMMVRAAAHSVGGYRRGFVDCEDYDLWVRLSERHDLGNLTAPLLSYRRHSGQTTWSRLRQRLVCEAAIHVSADRRRTGAADIAGSGRPLTFQGLLDEGVDAGDLTRRLRRIAIQTSANALSGRLLVEAKAALSIARSHGTLESRELPSYLRAHLAVATEQARAFMRRSRSGGS